MRAWNRAKLLWGYLTHRATLDALPVEYIVETTAKCNLYCPMCPRETHPQPKADMSDEVFRTLLAQTGSTAEHMMLIGLGEPFMDPKIFERIEYCHRHSVSTLLSTNGTFLDERYAAKVLDSPLEQITLSFDGFKKETFEFYRKGAKFEKVRDNFLRFARMKHERKSKLQIVVQMVRMEGNASEVDDFLGFWKGVPGVDELRIKEDETNLMRPDAGHAASDWKHPCHYLWRGAVYIKQNGDVYPCCQSYMLDGKPLGTVGQQPLIGIWNAEPMQEMRRLHAAGQLTAGYDVIGNDYGDMLAKGIIDPAKVTRSAVENAASIAGMILTTDALISDKPEPAPAGGGMPGGMGGMGGMDY